MRPCSASRRLVLLVLVLTCLAFASGTWGQSAPLAGGPLRTHPMNPRYFSDGSGRAIYLTGSHFWTTIQSWNATKVEAGGPYSGGAFRTFTDYVHFLKTRKHNFIRLWCFDSFQYESSPSPWVRTGPGTAFDGRPKWDVTKVNQAYLDRLRDRVQQLRENQIYVSVMFFRGNYALGTHPAWDAHPFKPTNNVNAQLAGLTYDAYNGLSHARSLELQKQYIRSVIDTLNDMDNVIWEIANEGQPAGYLWQQHLADYVRDYESTKPRQHLVGMTSTHPKDNTRLSNTTADWIAPGEEADFDQNNPPETAGTRPVFSDTDHHLLSAATVAFAWKSLVRGYHPILMENELAWDLEAVRLAMGHTRTQADRMNLAAMTPQNVLSETTYCVANPGVEYLVYAPNGGTFWVDLSAAAGKTLTGEWINPRTGVVVARSGVLGGQTRQSFSAPVNDFGAVLYLKSAGPTRGDFDVVIHAVDVPDDSIHGSWSKQIDSASRAGVKLQTTDVGVSHASSPLASPVDYFDVTFQAVANQPYALWLRLKALGNSKFNDAVWVQFSGARANGGPIYGINSTSGLLINLATDAPASSLRNWGWQNGAYWLNQATTVTFPTGGMQTIRIQVREDGVQLDQIVLSPNAYRHGSPGAVSNDNVIVHKPR